MRPIPRKLREVLAGDPWMKVCCLRWLAWHRCEGRVQWHHVWLYAGRQINEGWAIVPLCERGHDLAGTLGDKESRDAVQKISLGRSCEADRMKYPRVNWDQIMIKLGMKGGDDNGEGLPA